MLKAAAAPDLPPHNECGHKLVTGSIPPTEVAPAKRVNMFFGYSERNGPPAWSGIAEARIAGTA